MVDFFIIDKKENVMKKQRIYAIGDIHGQYQMLKELINNVKIDFNNSIVIFLGDYIDRGPQSFEVVEYLSKLFLKHPKNIILLKGNHEDLFLKSEKHSLWIYNGGTSTIKSYKKHNYNLPIEMPSTHSKFFKNLKLYYETENFIFVHAGVKNFNQQLNKESPDDLLWIRDEFIYNHTIHFTNKKIIFGHTPIQSVQPLIFDNKIGIDTGAGFGLKLTCLDLTDPNDLIFWNVEGENYKNYKKEYEKNEK